MGLSRTKLGDVSAGTQRVLCKKEPCLKTKSLQKPEDIRGFSTRFSLRMCTPSLGVKKKENLLQGLEVCPRVNDPSANPNLYFYETKQLYNYIDKTTLGN